VPFGDGQVLERAPAVALGSAMACKAEEALAADPHHSEATYNRGLRRPVAPCEARTSSSRATSSRSVIAPRHR